MTKEEIIKGKVLYEDGEHRFVWLGWEEEEEEGLVQTNQYLIVNRGKGVLLDPGGVYVLPRVLSAVSGYIEPENIEIIFYTWDPDVGSGIAVWLENTPAKVYISRLWVRFVPHFGSMDFDRIVPIEDSGGEVRLPSGDRLVFVPAHFLHSTGNFSLFDERSGILFSGDIGAAAFPRGERYLFVEDFERHRAYMEGFHRRYMASRRACELWVREVERLGPKMIAPQHGAIFSGDNVRKFLDWFRNLECGVDLIERIYRR
ncbi:MAG: MBL fold metallo-hydrolase [Aquificota bacterium]|nr:MBL fold metallo-hydrolase [Aquificota bacterium]